MRRLKRRDIYNFAGIFIRLNAGVDLLKDEQILSAKTISTDLFDTLCFRTCDEPEDVFRLQYRQSPELNARFDKAEGWLEARKSAEKITTAAAYPGEVTLDQIYGHLSEALGLKARLTEKLIALELASEEALIRPYAEIVAALSQLARLGKEIVITTDTYLPKAFIERLCKKFCDFEFSLLCSSDTGAPKRSGLAYELLKKRFDSSTLVHIGDNSHVDFVVARSKKVAGYPIEWGRQRWLKRNRPWVDYLHCLSIYIFETPHDANTYSPVAELAWRWSIILADFLYSLREIVDNQDITDIWFLSRDCETIFKASEENPGFFGAARVHYVYCSRTSTYPLIARNHQALYRTWTGREPDAETASRATAATNYFNSHLEEDSSHILLVDVGWKGRLQTAIRDALPSKVKLSGYYFSLEPDAEPRATACADVFFPFDRTRLSEPAIEALMGFVGDSCERFVIRNDKAVPAFRNQPGDRAPDDYCQHLLRYLASHMANMQRGNASLKLAAFRSRLLQSVCHFPDDIIRLAFEGWEIGSNLNGSDSTPLVRGGNAPWIRRLLGLGGHGNLWPALAIWGTTSQKPIVRALQRWAVAVLWLKQTIKSTRRNASPPITHEEPQRNVI